MREWTPHLDNDQLAVVEFSHAPSSLSPSSLHCTSLATKMVGFSDLSDSEDSAIDEIISQARDACVLDQLSKINCAGFTDSVLPSDLDSRFRKLKSLPVNRTAPPPSDAKARSFSTLSSRNPHETVKGSDQSPNFSPPKPDPDDRIKNPDPGCVSSPSDSSHGKRGLNPKPKPRHGSVSPPYASGSSNTSEESSMSSLFRSEKKSSKQRTLFSPLKSSNSLTRSPSPTGKVGCFWCSPKKKKSKENVVGWDQSDELLSDLGSLSLSKRRQKLLKIAMEEEEKICREAEKIVKWARHESARMNISDIEDELSDD